MMRNFKNGSAFPHQLLEQDLSIAGSSNCSFCISNLPSPVPTYVHFLSVAHVLFWNGHWRHVNHVFTASSIVCTGCVRKALAMHAQCTTEC